MLNTIMSSTYCLHNSRILVIYNSHTCANGIWLFQLIDFIRFVNAISFITVFRQWPVDIVDVRERQVGWHELCMCLYVSVFVCVNWNPKYVFQYNMYSLAQKQIASNNALCITWNPDPQLKPKYIFSQKWNPIVIQTPSPCNIKWSLPYDKQSWYRCIMFFHRYKAIDHKWIVPSLSLGTPTTS